MGKQNKQKKTQDIQKILKNKRTSRGITIPELKLYYKAIVIKYCIVIEQKSYMLLNGIEIPELDPHTYGYLIFLK